MADFNHLCDLGQSHQRAPKFMKMWRFSECNPSVLNGTKIFET